jgi:MFS transporter, DHA1 family, inner membrane transport protein
MTGRLDETGRRVRRGRLGLATLGLATFVVGTSELVVVGVLGQIARDVDVSISTAGTLVTAYALGIAVGGPVVTALTGRLDRRLMLRLALAAFVLGNLATAIATNYGLLLASRALTGTIHGLFVGVASVVAAGLVEPGHEGRALSIVFGGITISTVIGVPLGTLIGQAVGWQATFVGIVILGLLAFALTMAVMPPVAARSAGRLADQARSAFAPAVLAMLGVGFLIIGGQFSALTYLTPFLDQVTGVPTPAISAFLFAYGIAIAAGTFLGGRTADRSATATLVTANCLTAAALAILFLAGTNQLVAIIALGIWGLVGFGMVSTALQLRVISLAGRGGNLAASLGASAANAGIATGALLGGHIITHQGIRYTTLTAAIVCLLALPITIATKSLHPPGATPTEPNIPSTAGTAR